MSTDNRTPFERSESLAIEFAASLYTLHQLSEILEEEKAAEFALNDIYEEMGDKIGHAILKEQHKMSADNELFITKATEIYRTRFGIEA
jgi:hypothetical protein